MRKFSRCGLLALLVFVVLGCAKQDAMPDDAFITLCKKGTADEVRKALASGANANASRAGGVTALMFAAVSNPNPEVVKVLLGRKANIRARDKNGRTVLMFAAAKNSPKVVKILLAARSDVNARDNEGMTALMYAVRYNLNPEVVKVLLENGADVRAVDKDGHDALWYTGYSGRDREEIIQILKKYASSAR